MGIRINKCLGYGVEEFDTSKFVMPDDIYEHTHTISSFVDWWRGTYPDARVAADDMTMARLLLRHTPSTSIHHFGRNMYADESDNMYPIIFSPVGSKNWSRHDDDIDYQEAHNQPNVGADNVVMIDRPIYPHMGYMHFDETYKRGFKRITDTDSELPNLTPYVPYSIKLYIEYLGISNSFELWASLKPMIYTYWD